MRGNDDSSRGWRSAAVWGVTLCLALASFPVHAAPESVLSNEQAAAHFERAQEAFDREDYAAAIPELKAAYALENNSLLLYAWAQAERFNGDCRRALELYKRYLETDPPDQQRQLAEANVVDCRAELGEVPPVPPPVGDGEPDPADEEGEGEDTTVVKPPPGEDTAGPKPWYKDWLAPTLAGAGLAVAGTGGALVALGVRQGQDAPSAITEMDYFAEGDSARTKHTAGWVLVGVGGALVVGGAIRYALLALRPRKSAKTQARVVPIFGGRSAGLSVRF